METLPNSRTDVLHHMARYRAYFLDKFSSEDLAALVTATESRSPRAVNVLWANQSRSREVRREAPMVRDRAYNRRPA